MRIGVLALQGDVREHRAALAAAGADAVEVRRPEDLDGIDGVALPGGESTTLSMLLATSGLFDPLVAAVRGGLPAFGTCAGMILLADRVEGGRPDQRSFRVLDCTVRRNGYGRQRNSFESELDATGLARALAEPPAGAVLPAVFIRAPLVVEIGPEVQVLATLPGGEGGRPDPVAVRQGVILATTFHPELTGDLRLHRLFVAMAGSGSGAAR